MQETQGITITKEQADRGKFMYVIEAALEYFISIIIGGQYLTNLSIHLGIDQAYSSILLSFVQLGYVFQLFGLLLAKKKRVKGLVTLLHTVNQVAFALIYLVPFTPFTKTFKHIFFVAFLVVGYFISNFIGAPKLSWYMSFVDAKERGRFTATKEIWSLIGGVVFSYIVSFVIDHFQAIGQIETAFLISAIAIFILTAGHTLTMIFTPNVEVPTSSASFGTALKEVVTSKKAWKVFVVQIIYSIISTMAIAVMMPFLKYSKEEFGLGFTGITLFGFSINSEIFFATVAAIGAFSRVLVSRPMGRFADKHSFKASTSLCYSLLALALVTAAFITDGIAPIFYIIYTIIHSFALAGTNSGIINLLYEEVPAEQRTSAYALQQFVAGIIGFAFSFVASAFIEAVQKSGGKLLGLYAQQWLFILGAVLAAVLVIYVQLVLNKKKNNEVKNDE